jgi:hypothetical protein
MLSLLEPIVVQSLNDNYFTFIFLPWVIQHWVLVMCIIGGIIVTIAGTIYFNKERD